MRRACRWWCCTADRAAGSTSIAPALLRSRLLPHHRLRPARRGTLHAARGAARQHHAASDRGPGGPAPAPGRGALARVRRVPGAAPWRSPTARAHPERCLGLVLRGIFLCRRHEIDWFLYGMRTIFPEAWRTHSPGIPPQRNASDLLDAYWRRLDDPDSAVRMAAARAWSVYEGACSTLLPNADTVAYFASDRVALGLARIEAHYFRAPGVPGRRTSCSPIWSPCGRCPE